MRSKGWIAPLFVIGSVFGLTILILFISHSIVAGRLEAHVYTVPEEQRLTMVSDAQSIILREDIDLLPGVSAVSELFDENGDRIAFVIDAVSSGYDGDVVVRIAFDDEYRISVLDVLESAGRPTNLGYRAASSEFTEQFIGASSVTVSEKSTSGTLIKYIDGAYYSCAGVYSCVTQAFSQLEQIMQEEEVAQ
ncbi:MAG TPA: FMN-binding protein [Bacillota bacterium]|nr:FMN-binding protein [Bacillota bacterium]